MWTAIAAGALILSTALIIYIISIKKQLRTIAEELDKNEKTNYNRLVSIALFDKDVNLLASAVNRNIEGKKQMKYEQRRMEENMKCAASNIAHDLRTPLSVIKGDLQLIAKNKNLSDEYRNYVNICIEKTDELKTMSDSFFELAVLESDTSKAELKKINLTNLLMTFIAENEGLIRMTGLQPDIIFPPKTVFAMGEENLLMRILGNLMGNVIKYSCGTFTVELTENAEIKFSNPANDAADIDTQRIFERSYRADSSRKSGSAGLGLYIVKLLCNKISADVKADINDDTLTITVMFSGI